MINKFTEISTHFNIPYQTLMDWKKSENWRYEFLEKLDEYLFLEKKAVKKFFNKFNEEELEKLFNVIFRNDIDNIVFMSIENLKIEILRDEVLNEKDKAQILEKLNNFCDFELYSFIDFMYKYAIQDNNQGIDLIGLKKFL